MFDLLGAAAPRRKSQPVPHGGLTTSGRTAGSGAPPPKSRQSRLQWLGDDKGNVDHLKQRVRTGEPDPTNTRRTPFGSASWFENGNLHYRFR